MVTALFASRRGGALAFSLAAYALAFVSHDAAAVPNSCPDLLATRYANCGELPVYVNWWNNGKEQEAQQTLTPSQFNDIENKFEKVNRENNRSIKWDTEGVPSKVEDTYQKWCKCVDEFEPKVLACDGKKNKKCKRIRKKYKACEEQRDKVLNKYTVKCRNKINAFSTLAADDGLGNPSEPEEVEEEVVLVFNPTRRHRSLQTLPAGYDETKFREGIALALTENGIPTTIDQVQVISTTPIGTNKLAVLYRVTVCSACVDDAKVIVEDTTIITTSLEEAGIEDLGETQPAQNSNLSTDTPVNVTDSGTTTEYTASEFVAPDEASPVQTADGWQFEDTGSAPRKINWYFLSNHEATDPATFNSANRTVGDLVSMTITIKGYIQSFFYQVYTLPSANTDENCASWYKSRWYVPGATIFGQALPLDLPDFQTFTIDFQTDVETTPVTPQPSACSGSTRTRVEFSAAQSDELNLVGPQTNSLDNPAANDFIIKELLVEYVDDTVTFKMNEA